MLLKDAAISAALAGAAVGTQPADSTASAVEVIVGANASTALIGADHCDAVTALEVLAVSDVSLTATEQSQSRQSASGTGGAQVGLSQYEDSLRLPSPLIAASDNGQLHSTGSTADAHADLLASRQSLQITVAARGDLSRTVSPPPVPALASESSALPQQLQSAPLAEPQRPQSRADLLELDLSDPLATGSAGTSGQVTQQQDEDSPRRQSPLAAASDNGQLHSTGSTADAHADLLASRQSLPVQISAAARGDLPLAVIFPLSPRSLARCHSNCSQSH